MSGLDLITVLEIFNHPHDLMVSVGGDAGKFSILICRGPGHNFKLLISSKPVLETKSEAADIVGELLNDICRIAKEKLENPTNLITAMVNPDHLPVSEMVNILTPDLISRMVVDLKEKGCAETHTYETAASA